MTDFRITWLSSNLNVKGLCRRDILDEWSGDMPDKRQAFCVGVPPLSSSILDG